MVMGNNQKFFSPSLKCELLAARAYDRYLIQIMGLSAKTNFSYTRRDLILIIKDIESDLQFADRGDLMRISFSHFKICQSEIESAEDQLRI